MKHIRFSHSVILLLLVLAGCHKSNYTSLSGGTALTIVNAIVNSNSLVTNFAPNTEGKASDTLRYFNSAQQIAYTGFQEFGSYTGNTNIALSPITDTVFTAWAGTVTLPLNTIHTLFVIGADTTQVDTLFTVDNPPYHPSSDSSVGIRFVNVAPASPPVSVDLQGMPNGSEVLSLPYKGVTSFKNYAANASVSTYIFEFRDPTSGNLLASFEMDGLDNGTGTNTINNGWRYRNVTIALMGIPTSGNQVATLIYNY